MGMNIPIILYTHTDMKDVWPMAFGQIKKYLVDFKIYVAVNATDSLIPSEFTTILYDDTLAYTNRWQQILHEISESTILFLHEDMIVLGTPDADLIQTYLELIESKKIRSVKLIFAGDKASPSFIHPTLVSNEFAKLSVQPTIIGKESFIQILTEAGRKNIWDFENSVSRYIGDFMAYVGTETKRGMFHYDSYVFPYIATAINKGKWNYTEYKQELDILFSEYSINPALRGVV
jgi:hypothetical protein